LVLSLLGRPLVDFLSGVRIKRFYIPKGVAAFLTLITIWTFFLVFLRIFIPLVAHEANDLSKINVNAVISELQGPISGIEDFYESFVLDPGNEFSLNKYLRDKLAGLLSFTMVTDIFGEVANVLGNFFLAIFSISFITFFFLKDKNLFSGAVLLLTPKKYEEAVSNALDSIRHLLMRYFIGVCIQVTGIIILVTTGMTIIGVGFRHGLVIGLVAGMFNIIPYLGPLMGTAVGIILGIATNLDLNLSSELLPLIGLMALVFGTTQIIDNVIFQPLIYSSSVHAHPLEIFLVIMIAGSAAGIGGMILAIPVYTVLRVFAREFFSHLKVVKKITENISE
jgi:predicted PurR-regulated permease PerM